jgi:opacity protein-like surface antigen
MRLASVVCCLSLLTAAPLAGQTPPADQPSEPGASGTQTKPGTDAQPGKPSSPDGAAAARNGDRYYVHFNVGSQLSSPDFVQRGGVPVYEETATFEVRGESPGGVLLDVGGGYRVWRRLAAGLSYSRVSGDIGGPLTGGVPDPIVHDLPLRPITGSVSDLNHVEHAVHFQAVWRHPLNDRLDVSVAIGPTLFSVSQDLVSDITIVEEDSGPRLTGVAIEEVSDTAVGFHVGADGSYHLTPRLAVGAFLRYAAGTVDLAGRAGEVSLDVGGLQVGVGVRLRFQ